MTTTSAKSSVKTNRAPRAKKSAVQQDALVLNHTTSFDAGDMALEDLINSLNAPDEVMEPAMSAVTEVDDAMLAEAVSGAEATEATMAFATPTGVVEAGAEPTGDASDVVVSEAVEAEAEPKVKKEKKAAIPRKHYTDKTERLKDKLGADLAEYSVLTMADAGVSAEDLARVMEATMDIIRGMNKKSQNWAVKYVEFLAGKKSAVSEVTGTLIKLLQKDGFLTTGNDGNVFKSLVSRPYSPGAARAMGGNNIAFMRDLKMIIQDSKGKFIANPESTLLLKGNSMILGAVA